MKRSRIPLMIVVVILASAALLILPAAAQEVIYTVQAGDTLSSIAAQYGVTVDDLAAANGINDPSLITVGQRLVIPVATATPDATATPAATPTPSPTLTPAPYEVLTGDTLASIAAQHHVTVLSLAAANSITSPSELQPGQRLIIPFDAAAAPQAMPVHRLKVQVSISQQRCWVWQDDELLYEWRCSTGRVGSGTKTGTFYVQSKYHDAWGSRWGFYMPFWLGIYWAGGSENGIHGLPYQPGGYPIWANSVGTPVTYGCVLLGADESITLWNMAYIGMPVEISY